MHEVDSYRDRVRYRAGVCVGRVSRGCPAAELPAFTAMHEVIMPLWHDAWPAKDTQALAKMLPAIEKHTAAVAKAELPGILRDKRTAWEAGVVKLQATVSDYRAAVKSGDSAALLAAAEALHMQYEALGRVIRPVLPEVEAFHATLYVIYHYQLHPLQLEKLVASAPELKQKMDALNQAQAPDTLKAKKPAFEAQRARLSKAVDALLTLLPWKDEAKISQAVELMHIEYDKLVKSTEG
jgi:hypothetical protein